MNEERPLLGAETEIALGLVDLSDDLDLAADGSVIPIVGSSYTVITCTQDIRVSLPADTVTAIPNGWNPAGQLIPGRSKPGQLSFNGLLKSQDTIRTTFNGKLCVARLRHIIEQEVVDTHYCTYFNPSLELNYPEGDATATVSGEGMFLQYST
jgi:hypothetical protein